ncbi:ATP-binding cassette domain-containing protein [Breoghania sp. L-A4]|uniref:ATP-binding cassette domain-containing protein n=1 Tax=Breoghania sp. L-A4 TaxID=2304600 RepID=UPI000E360821|nr:ATP-binding cassette domain-containing protein [Breoghania sp. L-A4]AXS39205.1 ATP-binding cassette domain-containing protein [Breoghania sp. L-A4]
MTLYRAPNDAAGLTLRNVRIARGERQLLHIDAHIAPGEALTVMGESGSGKSTLLAYIGGFLAPAFSASGQVLLDGEDVSLLPANRRHVGLLFQDDLLFPHMSVVQNLMFAIPEGGARGKRRALAVSALADVSLTGCEDRDPATLSGGQRARVALMRVLLSRPRALLLDEPFSKLDMALRDQVRELVFTMARARNLPMLLVTHDIRDAEAAGGARVDLDAPDRARKKAAEDSPAAS